MISHSDLCHVKAVTLVDILHKWYTDIVSSSPLPVPIRIGQPKHNLQTTVCLYCHNVKVSCHLEYKAFILIFTVLYILSGWLINGRRDCYVRDILGLYSWFRILFVIFLIVHHLGYKSNFVILWVLWYHVSLQLYTAIFWFGNIFSTEGCIYLTTKTQTTKTRKQK